MHARWGAMWSDNMLDGCSNVSPKKEGSFEELNNPDINVALHRRLVDQEHLELHESMWQYVQLTRSDPSFGWPVFTLFRHPFGDSMVLMFFAGNRDFSWVKLNSLEHRGAMMAALRAYRNVRPPTPLSTTCFSQHDQKCFDGDSNGPFDVIRFIEADERSTSFAKKGVPQEKLRASIIRRLGPRLDYIVNRSIFVGSVKRFFPPRSVALWILVFLWLAPDGQTRLVEIQHSTFTVKVNPEIMPKDGEPGFHICSFANWYARVCCD